MNLVDLSKIITESTLEVCKMDIFPSDVEVIIKDNENSFCRVHCVELRHSDLLNKCILILSNKE